LPRLSLKTVSRVSCTVPAGRRLFLLLVFLAVPPAVDSLAAPSPADSCSAVTAIREPGASGAVDSLLQGRDSLAGPEDSLSDAAAGGVSGRSFDFFQHQPERSYNWVWFFSAILIVIGLLYLFLYLLRRFFYQPRGTLGGAGEVELLQQFHLGPKKSLTLVRACGKILLLGVTDSSINNLMEIGDEEELARIEARLGRSRDLKVQNFREIYQGLVGKFRK
jgi:flagellar biosynthetic protein FliO